MIFIMKSLCLVLVVLASATAQVSRAPLFRVSASPAFARPQTFQPPRYDFQQRLPVYRVNPAPVAVPIAPPPVPIIQQTNIQDADGRGYSYSFEGGDKTVVSQRGVLKTGPEGDYITTEGSFSFIGTDGVTYTITYKADENGFQPQGAHIPKVSEAAQAGPSFIRKK